MGLFNIVFNCENLLIFCPQSPCTFKCAKLKKKVQVGKDQEKAQSDKDSHSKNRGGKKPN